MSNEEYLEIMKKREAIEEDFQCDKKLDVEPFECEDNCRFFYRGGTYEQHSHCLLKELMYWTTYHAASLYENPIPKARQEAIEQKPCDEWYDVPSDEMTLEQARQAVRDLRKKLAKYLMQEPCLPPVNPQEPKMDVLDKIRAEILKISSYEGFELGGFKDGYRVAMVNVLDIIDKYILTSTESNRKVRKYEL